MLRNMALMRTWIIRYNRATFTLILSLEQSMRSKLFFVLAAAAFILAACSGSRSNPAGSAAEMESTQMPPMNATATHGSMMADNPAAAHMMEPISGSNVQPATETTGGQPLAYREENGIKIFELTTRVVQWSIMDGVSVTAYTYN